LFWVDDEKKASETWKDLLGDESSDDLYIWPGKSTATSAAAVKITTVAICRVPCEYAKMFSGTAGSRRLALVPFETDIPMELVDTARRLRYVVSVADLPSGPWYMYQATLEHIECSDPLHGPRLLGKFSSLLRARRKAFTKANILDGNAMKKCISAGFDGWKKTPAHAVFYLPRGKRAAGMMVALVRAGETVWFATAEAL
jgi:hypothetical protein